MNRKIVELLMTDGKLTHNEVAAKLHRSASTIRDRIRRLEDDKVILGYVAMVNSERIGMNAEGVLFANMTDGAAANKLKGLSRLPGVTEVLQISGRRRVMIRLLADDNRALQEIIHREILPLGLKDAELHIVLDSVLRFPGI